MMNVKFSKSSALKSSNYYSSLRFLTHFAPSAPDLANITPETDGAQVGPLHLHLLAGLHKHAAATATTKDDLRTL